ncbi:MmgE/PrpD family protein [Microvirga sp. TS319]|uniref:MmgE/PrpD family protein n=1 Tax=Microvirga sp. TS319 TaxID=3241165 RepID=UPI00351A1751
MTVAISFIHRLSYADLPDPVIAQAKRCLLDLIGVAASGRQSELSRIVHNFAVSQMGASGTGARLLFDGRRASPAGAAYAGASTIDSFDAHDGHRLTKGHAGVALLPAALASMDASRQWDGRELLTSLVLGYEIATRAGMALHGSVEDYHTSGAWNALGCASMLARHLKLDETRTRHALGIAEYHGPRSQMMRCIDHPTMVKDGSGWGALAGVSAAHLASDGFTGAPAVLIEADRSGIWDDLGERWYILEQYFKPYPVCRWAQPAAEAASRLVGDVPASRIAAIEIRTFSHGVRLGTVLPTTTEQAQYALGFPVAALLVRGQLGADEIMAGGLVDGAIAALASRIRLVEDEAFSARFPAERIAAATITLDDGTVLTSGPTSARGDPESPLTDDEILQKFRTLTELLPRSRRDAVEHAVADLDRTEVAANDLADAVLSPLEDAVCEPCSSRNSSCGAAC